MSSASSTSSSPSSSSSGDIVRTGKSSLVFQTPVLTPVYASITAVLDLDAIDVQKVNATGRQYINMSGDYAGYKIAVYQVKVEDGMKLTLVITPRMRSTAERATSSAWQEAALSRVRAALADIRAEYDAAMAPGNPLTGELI